MKIKENLKNYLKNPIAIAIVGTAVSLSCLGITLNKYFQLKQNYNKLSQNSTQTLEENRNLKEEQEQFKTKHNQTLEKLTRSIKENTRLLEKNSQLDKQINQLEEEYQQSEQNRAEVNKQLIQLEKKHNEISQNFNKLAQAYHIISSENETLREKAKKEKNQTLEKIIEKTEEKMQKETLSYKSSYCFPGYEVGLLNGQESWKSSDTLEKKGWKVIKKEHPDALKQTSPNILTFKPSDFETFSPNDNYATFHLYSNKLIKSFSIAGECNISKNGFLEIFISGDNKNWTKLEHFESKREDNFYRVAFGSSSYYADAFPHIKLKNDLYIKHSAGAKSNKDYEVEIWSFSAYLTAYKDYEEKLNSIHFLFEQITFLEEMKKK